MKSISRSRCARSVAAGLLSAALLTGGAVDAFAAASPKPPSSPAASPAADKSITVKPDKVAVKVGDQVIFIGRTKGLKVGSKLVLQHLNNGKWTTLQSGTTVKNGSSYTLPGKLNTKGKEQLRIMGDDKTVSPTVVVTVS
ncbi:hypothetical protein ACIP46_01045 [Streptomyces lavendulae]|uniref:hypothetical protein n=1 Tax=Streptomyces lavendulae TaxID=1914 RepID=UPI0024A25833|nr:hypothetical protein [Streptomyces lavendulae]GLV96545.1 hypothetical protein Slala05_01770 [Streptomyces lavendulae subsp. lavendulae]GLX34130.1 hypothetical protein Sros01_02030 [Streptomyces roseochromogenus]